MRRLCFLLVSCAAVVATAGGNEEEERDRPLNLVVREQKPEGRTEEAPQTPEQQAALSLLALSGRDGKEAAGRRHRLLSGGSVSIVEAPEEGAASAPQPSTSRENVRDDADWTKRRKRLFSGALRGVVVGEVALQPLVPAEAQEGVEGTSQAMLPLKREEPNATLLPPSLQAVLPPLLYLKALVDLAQASTARRELFPAEPAPQQAKTAAANHTTYLEQGKVSMALVSADHLQEKTALCVNITSYVARVEEKESVFNTSSSKRNILSPLRKARTHAGKVIETIRAYRPDVASDVPEDFVSNGIHIGPDVPASLCGSIRQALLAFSRGTGNLQKDPVLSSIVPTPPPLSQRLWDLAKEALVEKEIARGERVNTLPQEGSVTTHVKKDVRGGKRSKGGTPKSRIKTLQQRERRTSGGSPSPKLQKTG